MAVAPLCKTVTRIDGVTFLKLGYRPGKGDEKELHHGKRTSEFGCKHARTYAYLDYSAVRSRCERKSNFRYLGYNSTRLLQHLKQWIHSEPGWRRNQSQVQEKKNFETRGRSPSFSLSLSFFFKVRSSRSAFHRCRTHTFDQLGFPARGHQNLVKIFEFEIAKSESGTSSIQRVTSK